jgi:hypothetical protein
MAGTSGVVTGGECFFAVDGVKFASARSITIQEQYDEADYDPVGKAEVEEVIILSYKVSWQIRSFRLLNRSLKKSGLQAKTARPSDVFKHLKKTIEVVDADTGTIIERLKGCVVTGNERSYEKGTESYYNINGRATRVTDEAEN